jgi:transposase
MRRFVEGTDRGQSTLFPECLGDWISEDNPVRVIDVFVDELDLAELGFNGVEPEVTGRPSYHPSVLLKLYIYGYLNRVQSSRRLEREAGRNDCAPRRRALSLEGDSVHQAAVVPGGVQATIELQRA